MNIVEEIAYSHGILNYNVMRKPYHASGGVSMYGDFSCYKI